MKKSNRKTTRKSGSKKPTRSDIQSLAAVKAHCHPTFQKPRTPKQRDVIKKLYLTKLREFNSRFPAYKRAA